MTHRNTGMKPTLGSGIPCVGFLLELQECCGFSLRVTPVRNDVTVEGLVRRSRWSLVVTHKYRVFQHLENPWPGLFFWEAPGNYCHQCFQPGWAPWKLLESSLLSSCIFVGPTFILFFPWDWVQTNWGRMFCAGLVPPKDGSSPGGSSPGRNVRDINGNKEENPSGMEEKSKLGTPWVVITKKGFGRRNLDPLTLDPPLWILMGKGTFSGTLLLVPETFLQRFLRERVPSFPFLVSCDPYFQYCNPKTHCCIRFFRRCFLPIIYVNWSLERGNLKPPQQFSFHPLCAKNSPLWWSALWSVRWFHPFCLPGWCLM